MYVQPGAASPYASATGVGIAAGFDTPSRATRPSSTSTGVVPRRSVEPGAGGERSFVLSAFDSSREPGGLADALESEPHASSLNMLIAVFFASRFFAADAVSCAARVVTCRPPCASAVT